MGDSGLCDSYNYNCHRGEQGTPEDTSEWFRRPSIIPNYYFEDFNLLRKRVDDCFKARDACETRKLLSISAFSGLLTNYNEQQLYWKRVHDNDPSIPLAERMSFLNHKNERDNIKILREIIYKKKSSLFVDDDILTIGLDRISNLETYGTRCYVNFLAKVTGLEKINSWVVTDFPEDVPIVVNPISKSPNPLQESQEIKSFQGFTDDSHFSNKDRKIQSKNFLEQIKNTVIILVGDEKVLRNVSDSDKGLFRKSTRILHGREEGHDGLIVFMTEGDKTYKSLNLEEFKGYLLHLSNKRTRKKKASEKLVVRQKIDLRNTQKSLAEHKVLDDILDAKERKALDITTQFKGQNRKAEIERDRDTSNVSAPGWIDYLSSSVRTNPNNASSWIRPSSWYDYLSGVSPTQREEAVKVEVALKAWFEKEAKARAAVEAEELEKAKVYREKIMKLEQQIVESQQSKKSKKKLTPAEKIKLLKVSVKKYIEEGNPIIIMNKIIGEGILTPTIKEVKASIKTLKSGGSRRNRKATIRTRKVNKRRNDKRKSLKLNISEDKYKKLLSKKRVSKTQKKSLDKALHMKYCKCVKSIKYGQKNPGAYAICANSVYKNRGLDMPFRAARDCSKYK